MQNVIELKRADVRRKNTSEAARQTAEIVLFPGVRYEYHDRAASESRRVTNRDRLEVGE